MLELLFLRFCYCILICCCRQLSCTIFVQYINLTRPSSSPHSTLSHTHSTFTTRHLTNTNMQFNFKTAFLALAVFLPLASATALAEKREEDGGHPCKPLLQSCAVDSECCGDLCLVGVRRVSLSPSLTLYIVLLNPLPSIP